MFVLSDLIEVNRAKHRIQLRGLNTVSDGGVLGRSRAFNRIRKYFECDVSLHTVIRGLVTRSRAKLFGPLSRAGPLGVRGPLSHRDCVLGSISRALQKIRQRESSAAGGKHLWV